MFGNEFLVFVGTHMWHNYFEYTSTYLKVHDQFLQMAQVRATNKALVGTLNSSQAKLYWREVRITVPSLKFNQSVKFHEGHRHEWKLLKLPAMIQEATRFLSGVRLLLYEIRLHRIVGGLKWLRILSIIQLQGALFEQNFALLKNTDLSMIPVYI